MKIAIPKEIRENERRVSATPETVKKLIKLGALINVEKGAGIASSFSDEDYQNAGATLTPHFSETVKSADFVFKVLPPDPQLEIPHLPKDSIIVGMLRPFQEKELIPCYQSQGITTFALELLPRTTRAQSMDVLSSQSNLSGFRAVIEAAYHYGKAFPMMMTAAGTLAPARVLVLGAGVAGLQAIATAKRLGAKVSAFDVRKSSKEEVLSLGATFIEVESEELGDASGGYAKEMSEEYKKKQSEKIRQTLTKTDIVITTALIPGKKAPTLLNRDQLKELRPGSVVVDLAAASGGNVEGTVPDKITTLNGVKIVGLTNMPSQIPTDSSHLYAKNLLNFFELLIDKNEKKVAINWEDEIIKATAITHQGKVVNNLFS